MFTIKQILSRPVRHYLMNHLSFLPDKLYIQLFFFAACGKFVDFKSPKGYNEKLQWMKLYDRHPEYSILADKIEVRKIVNEKIGYECTIPLLGYWNNYDEIDFDKLPNEFVLKCSHDSGSVRIIEDWHSMSYTAKSEMRQFFIKRLKKDFYFAGREYCYKGIKPRILAEPLMGTQEERKNGLKDYKIFCFNGVPKIILIITGRRTEKHKDFFDADFNWLPEIHKGYYNSSVCPTKPKCFEKMISYAKILSSGIRHVRMDFYEINGKVYFGEYTFYPGGGFELFYPPEWERKMGEWIDLNSSKNL